MYAYERESGKLCQREEKVNIKKQNGRREDTPRKREKDRRRGRQIEKKRDNADNIDLKTVCVSERERVTDRESE